VHGGSPGDIQVAAKKKPPWIGGSVWFFDQFKTIASAPPPLASGSRKTRNTGGR
jgi:hypothetical protein